jgi:hypothetical protein
MEKDWKLFHLQTKQLKKIGNFFTYKPNNGKQLETMEKTMENNYKLWKLWNDFLMGILATFVARHSSESCNGGQLYKE